MDPVWFLVVSAIGIFGLGCLLGSGVSMMLERHWWQDEMIKRRHAVYHWVDGRWYWNEDEPDVPRDPIATKVAVAAAERKRVVEMATMETFNTLKSLNKE